MPKKSTRKATKKTPEENANQAKPPTWPPLLEYLKQQAALKGSMRLTIIDLEQELESGKRRSMRRDLTTGRCEPVPPAFWKENIIYYDEGGGRPYVGVVEVEGPKDEGRWNVWASDPGDEDGGHVYFVSSDLERRGRDPKLTEEQKADLQAEYRGYKKDRPVFKKEDANEYLRGLAKEKFGIIVQHKDTIRDHVMKPVDEPDHHVEK